LDLLSILAVAFGLAMDAFAVSIAAGLTIRRLGGRHVFRLAFYFGLFQFLMPVLGWLAGRTLQDLLAAAGPWIAFILLAFIGGKMIWESFHTEEQRAARGDPSRGWTLISLSIAISLDALAVGVSLALLDVSIWTPSLVIGLVAGGMTAVGTIFGSRLGARFGA
jgi:putative Mn2+ efflux pump MntP